MSLLTVGTVAFDALETPFAKIDRVIGGSAMFASLSASFFYKDVQLVSVVGDDWPKDMIANFGKRGIDMGGLEIKEGEKSFFWSGRYHDNMISRDTLDTQLNVLADFDPKVPEAFKQPSYLMLANLDPDLQLKVIDQLTARPKFIMADTMNFWMDIKMDAVKKVLTKVDLITVNDEEARQLTGEYSIVKAAHKMLEMGPKTVIIKKGEHGALLFHTEGTFYAPALPLAQVFDPTGAGDTFAGGLIGHLAKTQDLSYANIKRAVIYGSAMASFCVEQFGPMQLLELTKEDIDGRLAQFVGLTDWNL